MSQKSKFWFWFGLALFAIPEILWSPVSNFFYEFTQTGRSGGTAPYRINFLQQTENLDWLSLVLGVQTVGALFVAIACFAAVYRGKNKALWSLLGSLFILISLASFFFAGISLTWRSIGL